MTTLWGKTPKKETAPPSKLTGKRGNLTRLGKSLTVIGNISGEDSCQIDGAVEGEFDLKGDLRIGPSANVMGDIRANDVTIGGKVEGKIKTSKRIHIQSTAQVQGSLNTPRLSIEEGAVFNGDTLMAKESKPVVGSDTVLRSTEPVDKKPLKKA